MNALADTLACRPGGLPGPPQAAYAAAVPPPSAALTAAAAGIEWSDGALRRPEEWAKCGQRAYAGSADRSNFFSYPLPAAAWPVPALTADQALTDALDIRSGQTVLVHGAGGADAAVNAARSGARDAVRAVRDGGRLATITADPPAAERGIGVFLR